MKNPLSKFKTSEQNQKRNRRPTITITDGLIGAPAIVVNRRHMHATEEAICTILKRSLQKSLQKITRSGKILKFAAKKYASHKGSRHNIL
jgi:hypothetical protein